MVIRPDGQTATTSLGATWEGFLEAGFSEDRNRWSPHSVWQNSLSLLDARASNLWNRIPDPVFEYVCGIRGSGLAIATQIAVKHRIPLLWFRDSSATSLFPRHVAITAKRILLVDTHARTGYNLQRHCALLRNVGAHVPCAAILFDMDMHFQQVEERRGYELGGLLARYDTTVVSLWRWSDLRPLAKDSERPKIVQMYQIDSTQDQRKLLWG
jgi:orotate phosphoribosyltransferase